MSSKAWTLFWQKLGLDTEKRGQTITNYKPGSDKSALKKLGISETAIATVYNGTLGFPDKLMFSKLSKFARRDIDAVVRWTKTSSRSAGFLKLFSIISNNKIDTALSKYKELYRIHQYSQKGEGLLFTADNILGTLTKYNPKELVRRLNLKSISKYTYEGSTTIGPERLICITKGKKNNIVFKFIRLINKKNKKIEISISVDSKKEMAKTKDSLQRYFGSYLDSPEITSSTIKLQTFLKTGVSDNFTVTGVTYYDGPYRLSIFPTYSRFVNVFESTTYKEKMSYIPKRELQIADLRISYNDKTISKPIRISFLSYHNNIIGAILLRADDRNLSITKAKKLKADFKKDFGVPLNVFIKTDNLNESELYKYFLQTVPKKDIQLELRSNKAMGIYKSLLKSSLLDTSDDTDEQSRFCVNLACRNKFRPDWKRKTCPACGDPLILGKKIIINKISEGSIVDYLKKKGKLDSIKKLGNKLLKRKLTVGSILHKGQSIELVPLTSELKENQLEVLAHRFTNCIIVTSLDNVTFLEQNGFSVVSLHDLVYTLEENKGNALLTKINEAHINYSSKLHRLSDIAADRIHTTTHYLTRNSEIKNLGAELFEADCSVVLDRILGNSLWLGAKHRGSSVPDGFTAFPILDKKEGCIIWDGKFSQGKSVIMGKFSKNKAYIKAAKTNASIKTNGGLKSFVFISNNPFPKTFEKKYKPLIKGSRIKVNFLQGSQLKLISDHYRRFEKTIQNNQEAKRQYIALIKEVLLLRKNGKPIEIIDTVELKQKIAANQKTLQPISRKMKLTLKKKK